MKRRAPATSGFTYVMAVGMLLLWLTAVAHCTADCCSDDGLFNSTSNHSVTATATAATSSHNANRSGHHDPCFCDSLHSVCPVFPSAEMVRPDFGLVDSLNLVSADSATTLTQPETLIRRQPPDCVWTFTPEVCLGPAFRSLAPPVSSLG